MKIFHSPAHKSHAGRSELKSGRLGPCRDAPARLTGVADALAAHSHDLCAPAPFEDAMAARVHAPDFIEFLKTAWDDWARAHREPDGDVPDALPLVWPVRGLRRTRPETVDGRLSYYAMDAGTPITAGMWKATSAAAACAWSAAQAALDGAAGAFALVRPPGHHSGRDVYGGYGFLNNAAIAAQALRDGGAARVAVLDVDYHHGNGTQAIFYDRADVLYVSVHADPQVEYPFFLGHAEETGAGEGADANLNLPLPKGTRWPLYAEALETACARIERHRPDALVVSYGFDAYEGDPLGRFHLKRGDFRKMSARIAALDTPVVAVLEGGYASDDLGDLIAEALDGFDF